MCTNAIGNQVLDTRAFARLINENGVRTSWQVISWMKEGYYFLKLNTERLKEMPILASSKSLLKDRTLRVFRKRDGFIKSSLTESWEFQWGDFPGGREAAPQVGAGYTRPWTAPWPDMTVLFQRSLKAAIQWGFRLYLVQASCWVQLKEKDMWCIWNECSSLSGVQWYTCLYIFCSVWPWEIRSRSSLVQVMGAL